MVTWLSVIGVVLGVVALVGGFSLTSGLEQAFREKILGMTAHVFVREYGLFFNRYREACQKIETIPEVLGSSPISFNEGMATGPNGSAGVIVKGLIPERAQKVLDLPQYMREGSMAELGGRGEDGLEGILLGSELARKIGAKKGDAVTLVSPMKSFDPDKWSADPDAPSTVTLRVRGIFEVGFYEYDTRLAYVELSVAQRFFGLGDSVVGIEVAVRDPLLAGDVASRISATLDKDRYSVMEWRKQNRNLFKSLTYQRVAILFVLSVMVVLASCNVAIMLIMLVIERTRDIAILKAMGAKSSSILRIFVTEGAAIGFVGTALGLLGAFFFCEVILKNGVTLDPKVYGISQLPAVFDIWDYVMAGCGALLITFTATIFPALRAARFHPVDGLREVNG